MGELLLHISESNNAWNKSALEISRNERKGEFCICGSNRPIQPGQQAQQGVPKAPDPAHKPLGGNGALSPGRG
jgi:hypothetical protein